eukprot:4424927-Prymnesium_polylepis.1
METCFTARLGQTSHAAHAVLPHAIGHVPRYTAVRLRTRSVSCTDHRDGSAHASGCQCTVDQWPVGQCAWSDVVAHPHVPSLVTCQLVPARSRALRTSRRPGASENAPTQQSYGGRNVARYGDLLR